MSIDAAEMIRELFERILSDPDDVSGVLADLDAELVSSGLVDADLTSVDISGIATDVLTNNGVTVAPINNIGNVVSTNGAGNTVSSASSSGGSSSASTASSGGSRGGNWNGGGAGGGAGGSAGGNGAAAVATMPPAPAEPSVVDIREFAGFLGQVAVQETTVVNQTLITETNNFDNRTTVVNDIDNRATNIDNGVDVNVGDIGEDGRVEIDLDTTNVNATGDGSVAAGDDVNNAATGERATVIDGDVQDSQLVSGDGAVATGDSSPVNTGTNSGQIGSFEDSNIAQGTGNQVNDLQDADISGAAGFGTGAVTNQEDVGNTNLDNVGNTNFDNVGNTTVTETDNSSVIDTNVDVADSFQDNSDNLDIDVADSFQDNSENVDVNVDADDSFQDNSADDFVDVAPSIPVIDVPPAPTTPIQPVPIDEP
jgi:hypothetical protein